MRHLQFALLLLSALLLPSLPGQTLEPRLYSNAPVGMNFLIAGYAHSEGAPSINPEAGLDKPHLNIDTAILAYARFFDLFGQSAKGHRQRLKCTLALTPLDKKAQKDG